MRLSWDKAVSRHTGAIKDHKGCHSREALNQISEAHWNDTIPYTNNLEAPKKHAICLRLNPRRNNPKKDGIAYQ